MSPKKPTAPPRQDLDALIAKVRAKVSQAPEKASLILKEWSARPSRQSKTTATSSNPQHLRKKAG
jgi:hypothetical protein